MESKASALGTNTAVTSKKKTPKAKALDSKKRQKLKLWTPEYAKS
jgi:hypothetical protein